MKYLLDTHVFIWFLVNKNKLSAKAKSILIHEPQIFVSVIGLWEISVKFGLGKLELSGATPESLWLAAGNAGIKFLPVSEHEAVSFYRLEKLHKDAFDRMIIWQAIENDMILLSKDDRMVEYKKYGLKLIW